MARYAFALAIMATMVLAPAGVSADTAGGQASAYLAYRQSDNATSAWSPLFSNGADGWTSTMVVRNEASSAVTTEFRMRSIQGGALLTKSISIPALSQRQITPSDLSLPDGFQGSVAANATPSGELSSVTYHDAGGRNRISLESPLADTALMIPLVFNDYNGWNSQVAVQNVDPNSDATVRVTYRGTDVPSVEDSITVRRDSSVMLNLAPLPKGPLTIEIENKSGSQRLVAAAHHVGPGGIADGNNATPQSQGAGKLFIPLLFRRYNDYDSGVRVVNVREGGALPMITFYDRDTGDRVGSITSARTLREGEEITFYLPTIDILQDSHVYSAVVEVSGSSSNTLSALGNHVNYRRDTAMLYAGSGRGDSALTAPVVYRAFSGLNSGIQIQSVTGSSSSVQVRFRNMSGTNITTESVSVQGNNSATVYLPAVAGLSDNYVGFAEITSSAPVVATVNAVRYTAPPTNPGAGT